MKTRWFFPFLAVLLGSLGSFAMDLQGSVFIINNQYYFRDASTQKPYLLQTDSHETQIALSKLKNEDLLLGTGTLLPNSTVLLESIDFVQLRRLIGIWKGPSALINFVDFNQVHFRQTAGSEIKYTYTLAPSDGDNWKIFFSDESSVVLGSVSVQNLKANLELYDSKTGNVYQRYELQKLPQ